MKIDLHCHSSVSDGALAPRELVARAAARGVGMLALTDHDQLEGLAEARAAAQAAGIAFVDGVEVSATWRGVAVHVVGLRIDPRDAPLAAGLARVRGGRIERARRIARELEAAGIERAFDGAMRYAAHPEMIGRTHFARYLVEIGAARDVQGVFRRYLAAGKPGYVAHAWAGLGEAVVWIRAAGGVAVLAHPARYPFRAAVMQELLGEFQAAGGNAIEVVCSSHSAGEVREYGAFARRFGLAASCGSDFHAPGEGVEFGELPALDARLQPVWRDWALAGAAA